MTQKQIDTNPNSPDKVFSLWLYKQSLAFLDIWHKDESIWGQSLLNHIFLFARSHEKTYEMFMWLDSKECYKLFKDDYAGKMILKKYEELNQNIRDTVALYDVAAVVAEIDYYYSSPDDQNIKIKLKLHE